MIDSDFERWSAERAEFLHLIGLYQARLALCGKELSSHVGLAFVHGFYHDDGDGNYSSPHAAEGRRLREETRLSLQRLNLNEEDT